MNKKYFSSAEEALAECEELTRDDTYDSQDRAILQGFYNGRQTMSECESDERGVSELTNHLFGYDSINTAAEQIFGIYSKSPIIWHINIKNAPDGMNQRWSQKATQILNDAIKHSKRLKPQFKAFAGEVTLFGSFHFCYYDNYDWCPRARRPLVPRGTGTVPEEVDYAVIRDDLRLKDLYAYKRRTERMREKGLKSGWNLKALNNAIDVIEDRFDRINAVDSGGGYDSLGPTPEEDEDDFEMAASTSERQRLTIPVYYLYTSRPDEEGTPFDMTVLARFSAKMKKTASENDVFLSSELFDKPRFFKKAKSFLHSFFIDCNIGGTTRWHKSMGLGRLNYDSDVDVEEFFNEAMQGSKENLRRMFQVGNSADVEAVNRWLSGEEYSNVLPEGVSVAEQAKNPNFQHAFQTMDMLMQLTRRNAAASISNSEGARATNELEVQALERQGRNAEAIANRMNDIYENLKTLGETIFERFLNTGIESTDAGYDEIKFFQEKMREQGIPLAFLRASKNGRFTNVEVKVNRTAGDGDRVREIMVNRSLMQRLPLFSPQAQQDILRRVTATETQDYDLAEELVPREQKIDGGQVNVANNENQSALQRGITGYVPQLNRDDIHGIHIPEHAGGIDALLAKGKVIGWDEMDIGGFQSMMQHFQLHGQQIAANPGQKQLANQMNQQLQIWLRAAKEYVNNFQAKKEAEQDQLSRKEQAELQLKGADHELKLRQQDALESHRRETNDISRKKAGLQAEVAVRGQNINASKAEQGALTQQASLQEDARQNDFHNKLALEDQANQKAQEDVLSGDRAAQGAAA